VFHLFVQTRRYPQDFPHFFKIFFHLTSFAQNEEFARKFHTKSALFHTKNTIFYTKSALLYTKNTLFYTKFTPFFRPFSPQNHTHTVKNTASHPCVAIIFPRKISQNFPLRFLKIFFLLLREIFNHCLLQDFADI